MASRRPHSTRAVHLPTRHLGLPDDYYSSPDIVALAAALRLPPYALPKFFDFVYRVVIGAIPLRAQLYHLEDKTCALCRSMARETFLHIFIDCQFVQNVWAIYKAAIGEVGLECPHSLQDFVFTTPRLRHPWQRAGLDSIRPILRTCI
ncbi:hypothetical protein ACHHYP_17329 [Achlya hypogyna]|uniref:Reverse transcriptase zinc-binding domain-containing protein n=1 Tax=Achlya hypogyna TaxID=1202772 RepID=A0A1V9Y4N8_ACHHY|nr:hypothetical protein ACHHYP_17329 [Achlya hypogyna]